MRQYFVEVFSVESYFTIYGFIISWTNFVRKAGEHSSVIFRDKKSRPLMRQLFMIHQLGTQAIYNIWSVKLVNANELHATSS